MADKFVIVTGDHTSMMMNGISSLMQMFHPAVLAGGWEHSNFRANMHAACGERQTARCIATKTYADRQQAEAAIARVRAVRWLFK